MEENVDLKLILLLLSKLEVSAVYLFFFQLAEYAYNSEC